jgi:hypothetical protein
VSQWPTSVATTIANTAAFVADEAIAVTMVSPVSGGSVTSSQFDVRWTFSPGTQQTYRVRIYSDAGATTLVYNSGVIASAALVHTVPAGTLLNSTSYWLRVDIVTTLIQAGQSPLTDFSTSFAPSANIAGTAVTAVNTGLPHFQIDWDQITPGGGETFIQYDVNRRKSGDTTWTRIATITTVTTVQYLDYVPGAVTTYEYSVVWQAQSGVDVLVSTHPVSPPSDALAFNSSFLHEWNTPAQYGEVKGQEASIGNVQQNVYHRARGRRADTAFIGEGLHQEIALHGVPLLATDVTLWNTLVTLHDRQHSEGSQLVLRVGHRPGTSFFVVMDELEDRETTPIARQTLHFREVSVDETV